MATQRARTHPSAETTLLQALPELPDAAVACILQHVPLQQRLTRCALVCRAWAAAAAGVPAEVSTQLRSSQHCGQLQDWLSKHAGVVVSLISRRDLSSSDIGPWGSWTPLQMPVDKLVRLRNLYLSWLIMQSAQGVSTLSSASRRRGSSRTGAGSSTSSRGSGIASSGGRAAAVLPQLQALGLNEVRLPVQLLSQLLSATSLTKLHWSSVELCDGDCEGKRLSQKQVLSTLWQHLQLLPKLSELKLLVAGLTSAVITPLGNQQHLQRLIFNVDPLYRPASKVTCQKVAKAVLAMLQPLTQLQHLKLKYCQLSLAGHQQPGNNYQCFSALTASTQLTALVLIECGDMPVPQAAFDYMFPPGRVLPHLQKLHLRGWQAPGHRCKHCVEAAQVTRIAASCPALQSLRLENVTPAGFNTSCLVQLPAGVTRVGGLGWVRPTP